MRLARVLYFEKRFAEAEPLARWALSVRDSDPYAKPDSVFQCVYTFGVIESALNHHDEAERLLKRSLALQEQSLGANHINSALLLDQLASVHIQQKKYKDARGLVSTSHRDSRTKNARSKSRPGRNRRKICRPAPHRRSDSTRRKSGTPGRSKSATRSRPRPPKARADRVAEQFKGYR